ncbi:cytochrome c oxidase assembly protein COX11, mitochondrial-like [Rutidosis leptorrhynchoides]|uniref:cytochrome c oxidase assembly protein COX11, mitochondrial-like n=1 Tax=Rutidosis leptorrhynchoides TaxID=125765 RepID=UPI003A9A5D78
MSFYAKRSTQLSSFYKTLISTPINSRCLLEVGQRRYSFVGTSSSRHSTIYELNKKSCNKNNRLGIGYLKTHYVSDSRYHYTTNVIQEHKSRKILYYLTGLVFAMVGCTYTAVPLYRRFCQATGYGGTVQRRETVEEKILRHAQDGTVTNREIVVQFNADVSDGMPWKFIPTQREVRVKPGESALAFYTAENHSSTPITGMSTYNVTPMKAAVYFNKIQCFCFEEQRLLPGEQIDMPVFFYIDPEFETDPRMNGIDNIILSYTFFKIAEDK